MRNEDKNKQPIVMTKLRMNIIVKVKEIYIFKQNVKVIYFFLPWKELLSELLKRVCWVDYKRRQLPRK